MILSSVDIVFFMELALPDVAIEVYPYKLEVNLCFIKKSHLNNLKTKAKRLKGVRIIAETKLH